MKYCMKCKITESQYDDFCTECGQKLNQVKKCPCGEEFYPSYNYCPKCGKYKDEAIDNRMKHEEDVNTDTL